MALIEVKNAIRVTPWIRGVRFGLLHSRGERDWCWDGRDGSSYAPLPQEPEAVLVDPDSYRVLLAPAGGTQDKLWSAAGDGSFKFSDVDPATWNEEFQKSPELAHQTRRRRAGRWEYWSETDKICWRDTQSGASASGKSDEDGRSFAIRPDAGSAYLGGSHGLREVELNSGKVLRQLPLHPDCLALQPGPAKYLAVADQDSLLILDSATLEALHVLRGLDGYVDGLAFDPSGKLLAVTTNDLIRVFELEPSLPWRLPQRQLCSELWTGMRLSGGGAVCLTPAEFWARVRAWEKETGGSWWEGTQPPADELQVPTSSGGVRSDDAELPAACDVGSQSRSLYCLPRKALSMASSNRIERRKALVACRATGYRILRFGQGSGSAVMKYQGISQ